MATPENKIVVSSSLASRLLKTMIQEKEELEEKVLDLQIEIEELENSLKTPLEPIDKKNGTDFVLSGPRVEALISKQSGLDIPGYVDILVVDLNLDKSNKETMKRLKQCVYSHLWALKKKGKVMTEYIQETASTVYYPISPEGNPSLKSHSKVTIGGATITR